MRLDEVVGELVHKDLIARIDRTARDDLAAAISVSRKNIEIVPQCFRRHVNQKLLVLTNETRESEEKEKLFLLYLQDLIVLARDDVDVISAAHHEFSDLLKKIRQRDCRFYFVTDDPVERRLHRTGWDFERLQKIGTNSYRYHNRDQNYFAIFPPVGFPRHR